MKRRICGVILTLCLFLGMVPPWGYAAEVASGTCGDNVTWSLDDNGTLTISGAGPMANYTDGSNAPWHSFRNYIINSIKTAVIENGVASIGSGAFADCSGLTSVTIPDSVTSIGEGAFYDCSGLISMTIPDSVTSIGMYAFEGCGLTTVTIPDSVTSIGGYSFFCSGLISVTIPDSVTSIRDYAFQGCSGLTDVYYSGTQAEWGRITIEKSNEPLTKATIHCSDGVINGENSPDPTPDPDPNVSPDDGKESHTVTFRANGGSGSMRSVTVSGPSYTLPENGFSPPSGQRFRAWRVNFGTGGQSYEYAPGVTVSVPANMTVTALWENDSNILAQGYCGAEGDGTNLSWTLSRDWRLTVSGTGDMESYSEETRAPWYGYHTNIESATLENGVSRLGSYAFTYCSALEEVTLPESLLIIENGAFLNCSALEEVTLPSGLRILGDSVFYGCESLTEMDIPGNISSMGSYTFEHCTALETVSLPAALTRIGYYAFHDCAALESIVIPSGVGALDIGVFSECGALETVTLPAGLTNINTGAFAGCGSLYSVAYPGTVEQFAGIAQTLGEDNKELKAHPVHCSNGDYDWTPPDPYRVLDALQDMDDFHDQTWHLAGALSEFRSLNIDSTTLTRSTVLTRNGLDYAAEEGSTKLNIPAETFRHFEEGSHTAAASFETAEHDIQTRRQIYTVFPKPGTAKIELREMLGVTGVENVSYNGRFLSDPVLLEGLYRFVVLNGELPPGLTLQDGGYFTGVARTAGTYYFTVGLQINRGGVWPSDYEDTVQIAITIEPGTEVKVETASDPGYEIVQPVPDQVTETVVEPEKFQLVSVGPFQEFQALYVDGEEKIRNVDYEVRPIDINENGVPLLMDGGIVTGTFIAAKSFTLSEGVHAVGLEFHHTDPLGNKKTRKAAQTVKVTKRQSAPVVQQTGGGGGGIVSSGSSTSYRTITKGNVSNGSIMLSNSRAKPGARVTISVTPANGYQVGSVTVRASNKSNVPVTGSNGQYTFTMPSRNVTVSATFTRPVRAVSVARTEHGAVSVSTDSQAPGETVTISTKPDRGYQLLGVTVRSPAQGILTVRGVSENVFSFIMPADSVTVNSVFQAKRLAFFTDIQGPDWFFEDAEWAYNRGIIRGVTTELWSPQKEISGVTAIITLERLDGVDLQPYYTGANDGLDNNAWYVAAARWAKNNGIFPADWPVTEELPLTRGEYAILLYNFARYRGLNVNDVPAVRFSDAYALTETESNAFRFLQGINVFQGFEDGAVKPRGHLSRAQLSALLHRFSDYVIRVESGMYAAKV